MDVAYKASWVTLDEVSATQRHAEEGWMCEAFARWWLDSGEVFHTGFSVNMEDKLAKRLMHRNHEFQSVILELQRGTKGDTHGGAAEILKTHTLSENNSGKLQHIFKKNLQVIS